MRLDVFTSDRHISGCRVATPGVMVMLAWVARRGADQTPVCANVCREWSETPLRYAESFPLGAEAGLPRCHTWCHGHAGMVVRCGADGCVC